MKLADFLKRPTVKQIRGTPKGKNTFTAVNIDTSEELENVVSQIARRVDERASDDSVKLFRDNTYLRFTHMLLPEHTFGKQGYDSRHWSLKTASKQFIKTQHDTFYRVARGSRSADEQIRKWDEKGSIVQLLIDDIRSNNDIERVRPGYGFQPTVSKDTRERFIYWDQLCAGQIIYELLDDDQFRMLTYFDTQNAKVDGGRVISKIQKGDELYTAHFRNVPFDSTEPNQRKRAFALACNSESTKTKISAIAYGAENDYGGHDRTEFAAPDIAAWYKVADTLGEYTRNSSLVIKPTEQLVDAFRILRNHAIFVGRQNSNKHNPGEYHLRQAQINYVLGSLIKRDPQRYLQS